MAARTSRAPRGGKFSTGAALAEIVDGVGEAEDRPDLVPEEDDGDGQEDEAGADHPGDEDQRVRRIGLAPPGEDAEDLVVELDADLDEVGAADRVDPERLADLLGDRPAEVAVEEVEERLRRRRRQRLWRQDRDVEAEAPPGDPGDLLDVGLAAD